MTTSQNAKKKITCVNGECTIIGNKPVETKQTKIEKKLYFKNKPNNL
jgi:hypothetical protein